MYGIVKTFPLSHLQDLVHLPAAVGVEFVCGTDLESVAQPDSDQTALEITALFHT